MPGFEPGTSPVASLHANHWAMMTWCFSKTRFNWSCSSLRLRSQMKRQDRWWGKCWFTRLVCLKSVLECGLISRFSLVFLLGKTLVLLNFAFLHRLRAEIVETTFVFPTLPRVLVDFVLFLAVSPPSFLFGLINNAIDYSWLNNSLNSFKIKCKHFFLT